MNDLTKLLDAVEWKPFGIPWEERGLEITHHATIELRGVSVTVWKLNDGRVLAEVEDLANLLERKTNGNSC